MDAQPEYLIWLQGQILLRDHDHLAADRINECIPQPIKTQFVCLDRLYVLAEIRQHKDSRLAVSIYVCAHIAKDMVIAHVDHVHSDAVIAIAASKDSERLTKEIFGSELGYLPWQRPGIALGIKQLLPDPWADLEERFPGDREVSGTVTRLADFGAFVELEPGLEGLLHVSQLGRERVRRASDVLTVGETVTVRIQSVDPAARRLSLTRLDARGAVLGSEEAVESDVIEKNLAKPGSQPLGTNLGALFKKALESKGGKDG